jgi:riboflavin synthase
MFTGIITETAPIKRTEKLENGLKLTFKKPKWDDLELGESIATNGVCLTVTAIRDDEYDVFLMPETLSKTSFGHKIPERVNLERALSTGDRFGGHFVQGHVDGVGKVIKINKTNGHKIEIKFPAKNTQLVMYKGSITVDGVSLTIASCKEDLLSVALIPHTLQYTTLNTLKEGDMVNLEFDMLGKYVVNILGQKDYAAS